ncbi:hypothetical protein U1Q18_012454 [Sarracenia purpurea var. burkii]
MGIVQRYESQKMEIEEFRRMLLSGARSNGRKEKEEEELRDQPDQGATINNGNCAGTGEKLVCVTSGVSFLGLAIVNRLLIRGYSVRLIVTNEEDGEKLRETELLGEMNSNISAVMASIADVQSLSEAFNGCRGVFHTSAFVDPAGLSGYSKSMADIEVRGTENVIEACARTPSIRSCVLTSSLLACIWRDNSHSDLSSLVNHDCWSDESVCLDKKLWYALGKIRAEKAAWRIAEEKGLKLVTICPGLVTGPDFSHRNPTATIAYLKGVEEMYADGLLATVDVERLAEIEVCVLEAMNEGIAFGRYVCFDRVIRREEEVEKLAGETGIRTNFMLRNDSTHSSFRFELSNAKLSRLISGPSLLCNHEC